MNTSLTRLQSFYGGLKAPLLLHAVIRNEFPGTIALATAFAADAGLLLSMVATIDPAVPVLCLPSGSHAAEAAAYGRELTAHLRLTRVHWVTPGGPEPLAEVLDTMGILALITGRTEAGMPRIALDESGVFRINPLAGSTEEERTLEMQKRNIPPHPLGSRAGTESSALAGLPEAIDAPATRVIDWTL